MKKLSIISLLVVFCFNMAGFYVLFGVQLFQVKNEMLGRLSSGGQQEELLHLKISSKERELLSFDDGKEFYYKGAMFDLVEKKRLDDGSLILSCYRDVEESALLMAFSNLLKTGRENHKNKNSAFKVFFKTFPKITREQEDLKLAFLRPLKKDFIKTSSGYTAPRLEKEGPPPRQV